MQLLLIKKYKNMLLIGLLSFYLGCSITLSFLKIDCACAENLDKKSALNNIEYAVTIVSGPNNELKRDAIRATWANLVNNIFIENGEKLYKWNHTWTQQHQQQNIIKLFFIIGTQGLDEVKLLKLKSEQSRSNDLLLLDDLEDSYNNLAKKVIHTLVWISENMKGLKYLVKCDDDSFVRIDLIIKDLEAFAPEMNTPEIQKFVTFKKNLPSYKGLYWGYFNGHAKIFLSGKWKEPDWFLCNTYLPYALGGGYVISKSIVDYVAKNSDFLSLYNSEDVSMGVWTAALDGVNRVHDIRFDTEWQSRGCDAQMLVRHKQTPSDMFQMYRTLVHSQGGKLCRTESAVRKFYLYKWNVLPTMCCK